MRNSVWVTVFAVFFTASCDLIIFDWWLPKKFEDYLVRKFQGSNLKFEKIDLGWKTAHLKGEAM